jgi:tetratricopeptide (TPR) repeat protein
MPTPSLAIRLALVGLMIVGTWTHVAHAETNPAEDRARDFTRTGNAHYEAGHYGEAEQAFREAYALSGRSGFLWNMAQCARLAGESRRALALYSRYLEAAPDGGQRAEAERWVAMLEAQQAASRTSTPPANGADERIPPRRILTLPPQENDESPAGPALYERWWFWAGTGAVVSGVVAAVLWSSSSSSSQGPAPDQGAIRW